VAGETGDWQTTLSTVEGLKGRYPPE